MACAQCELLARDRDAAQRDYETAKINEETFHRSEPPTDAEIREHRRLWKLHFDAAGRLKGSKAALAVHEKSHR